jgi:hypothetical protein
MRSYSDAQLTAAVTASHSWRGVLRMLGLRATSAGAMRSVQASVHLGLDYTHFTGQRRWTDRQLVEAVRSSLTWTEVASALGLAGGSSTTTLRGHALRLGLDTSGLDHVPTCPTLAEMVPRSAHRARAGSLLAAAWFELCGCAVSWPLEPCRYDLRPKGAPHVRSRRDRSVLRHRRRSQLLPHPHSGRGRTQRDPGFCIPVRRSSPAGAAAPHWCAAFG